MILTVKVTYLDGTTDIKECHDLKEIKLDNVDTVKVIRKEEETDCTHPPKKRKPCCPH